MKPVRGGWRRELARTGSTITQRRWRLSSRSRDWGPSRRENRQPGQRRGRHFCRQHGWYTRSPWIGAVLRSQVTAKAPRSQRHRGMGNNRMDTSSGVGAVPTFSRRRALQGLAGTAFAGGTGLSVGLAGATYAAPDEFAAKAVYLNPTMDDGYDLDRLLDLIGRTELNALVIDVKEQGVYVDTEVDLFREADTVVPYYDVAAVLDALHAHDVYAIARQVVFKDTPLAEARPDLAVADTATGGPWHDMNGVAWVNPFNEEVWTANIDLAVELVGRGFDEIQFDYVRFPTDGDLGAMDFGREVTEAIQVDTIAGFLAEARANLAPGG